MISHRSRSSLFAMVMSSILLQGVAVGASPVVDFAERGDVESVRQSLRAGADVNESQGDGMTALHWAAEHGDAELAKMLIYAGANVNSGTRIGSYTPLHIASRHGYVDVVNALLEGQANAGLPTSNSKVLPLHLAAASPSPETVSALLAAGTDINALAGDWDQTPLIFAASANRVANVRLLLEAGADTSITSKVVDVVEMERGDEAANKRLAELVEEYKLKAGGGPNWLPQPNEVQGAIDFSREIQRRWPDVPDPSCENPGDAASSKFSRAELPDRCDEKEAGDSEGDSEGEAAVAVEPEARRMSYGEWVGHWGGLTPLLHAVRQGNDDVVKALLNGGADINQASAGDHTSPLLMAAVNGQFDLALILLQRGADPNQVSDAGTTPLFAALERQWAPWSHYAHPVEYQAQNATYLELMSALLDAGADPNIRLSKHLWYAEFTVSVLIPAGLHYDGATPFWRAAQALDVDAMRLLKAHGAQTDLPTIKIPVREEKSMPDAEEEKEEEVDHSGLPEVPMGGPFVYPIHAAAGAGYGQFYMAHAHRHVLDGWLPAVRFLIEECGADVNLRDANAYTPLHHAAARGDNKVVEYLMEKGADVTAVSRSGQTTADMANGPAERIPPFPDTIDLLVRSGAKNNDKCVSC